MKLKVKILFLVLLLASFKGALMEFVPLLKQFDSYILLLIDVLITLLGLFSLANVPKRIILGLLALLIASSLNFLSGSDKNLLTHINGVREITNIYCLVIFFYALFNSGYQYYFNYLFRKFAIIFLFAQIPFAIKQFLEFGASDDVGGTLGSGYSGILTLAIFVLVYYLIENQNSQSNLSKLKYLFSISYFFIPVFLNETKITFILVPILFLTFVNFKPIHTAIYSATLSGLFLLLFASLFTSYGKSYDNPIKVIFSKEYLLKYLAAEETKDGIDIPRFTKLILATKLLAKDEANLLLGQEYGAFKGGKTIKLSPFSSKYFWLLQGSRPYLFYVLITGGIILVVLLLFLFIGLVCHRPYSGFRNFSNKLLIFLSFVFLLMLFYNDALRGEFFVLVFIYVLFFGKYFIYPLQLKVA